MGHKEEKKEKEKKEKEEKKEEKFLHTDRRTGGPIKGSTRGPCGPKNKIQFKFSALCETPSHICF